jgi:hypothetical protein
MKLILVRDIHRKTVIGFTKYVDFGCDKFILGYRVMKLSIYIGNVKMAL